MTMIIFLFRGSLIGLIFGIPASAENIGTIETGDIMLFGSDCLVVFYKSFDTSYSYTRVGHIANEIDLADAFGSGTAEITFSAE